RVVEDEVVEHDLVDGERYVALGLPLDGLVELLDGHAGNVYVPRDRLAVADGRHGEATVDASVLEERLDLFHESAGVGHLVVLYETWRHGSQGERAKRWRAAWSQLHHLERASPDFETDGLDLVA